MKKMMLVYILFIILTLTACRNGMNGSSPQPPTAHDALTAILTEPPTTAVPTEPIGLPETPATQTKPTVTPETPPTPENYEDMLQLEPDKTDLPSGKAFSKMRRGTTLREVYKAAGLPQREVMTIGIKNGIVIPAAVFEYDTVEGKTIYISYAYDSSSDSSSDMLIVRYVSEVKESKIKLSSEFHDDYLRLVTIKELPSVKDFVAICTGLSVKDVFDAVGFPQRRSTINEVTPDGRQTDSFTVYEYDTIEGTTFCIGFKSNSESEGNLEVKYFSTKQTSVVSQVYG